MGDPGSRSGASPASPPPAGLEAARRPLYAWLAELERVRDAAAIGARPKITILDVADRSVEAGCTSAACVPTSPRSVEACLRLGVDPASLLHRPLGHFLRSERNPELAQLAFQHEEALRQDRLKALIEERRRLEEAQRATNSRLGSGAKAAASAAVAGAEDLVEKEAKRLEVMRRRQERELTQLISYELARKEIQEKAEAKVKEQERRAEEQRAAKQVVDEEWRRQQHEREMQRKLEEEARQRKVQEAERYEREMERLRQEQEEEKRRRQEAYAREQERMQKAEQARLQTECILREQQEAMARRKAEMEKREEERETAKQAAAEERATANAEAQRQAAARIAAAQEANNAIIRKRREEYEEQQRRNEERRAARETQRQAEEQARRQAEARKGQQRQAAYEEAQRREAARVSEMLHKQREKDGELARLKAERDADAARRSLERKLQLNDKVESVEEMRRRDAYERSQALRRIEQDTVRTRLLQEQRRQLQDQRRVANVNAAMQRQQIVQAMEKLAATKSWAELGGDGGAPSINTLLAKK